MTPSEKRAAHPLISTSPNYGKYMAAKRSREAVTTLFSPLSVLTAALTSYRDELDAMLNAPAIYLGPGK